MDTTRRSFLKTAIGTGSLVAAGGFALPARAAEFQYKLGTRILRIFPCIRTLWQQQKKS